MKPLPIRPMRSFGLVMSEVLVDDEIGVEPPREEIEYVLDGIHRHPLTGLLCQARDVRRDQSLVEGEERMILGGRLVVEYVETRGADLSRRKCGPKCAFVDDPAARGVDDDDARLHLRELLGA